MIVGDPDKFAIESWLVEAYDDRHFMAMGSFQVHVAARCYGVSKPGNVWAMAYPWNFLRDRLAQRSASPFWLGANLAAVDLAIAVRAAWHSENESDTYLGIRLKEFWRSLQTNNIDWQDNCERAFDDSSHVLTMDHVDRVRVVAFTRTDLESELAGTVAEVWLDCDSYYGILDTWQRKFKAEWDAAPKVQPWLTVLTRPPTH